MTHFYFDARNHISGMPEARVDKICTHVSLGTTNYPLMGAVRIT